MNTLVLFFALLMFISLSSFLYKERMEKINTEDCLSKDYTNILRGLAIIMIMFGHVGGVYHESVWFSPFASTGVALFLMLSGYGNNESFVLKKQFKINKILRILLPYWILIFILFVINPRTLVPNDILPSFFLIEPYISGYWFVIYILKCYLVYWFSINFAYSFRWIIFLLFSIISFLFFSPLESEQSLSFITGIFISEKKEYIFQFKKNNFTIIAIICFSFAILTLGLKQLQFVRNTEELMLLVQLLYKVPLALTILICFKVLKPIVYNKFLMLLAPMTYELYLIHMPLLNYIKIDDSVSLCCSTFLFFTTSFIVAKLFQLINSKLLNLVLS